MNTPMALGRETVPTCSKGILLDFWIFFFFFYKNGMFEILLSFSFA